MSQLLESLGTVEIPAIPQFVVLDHFVVNTSRREGAGVKISSLGPSFQEWFLGKIEEPITGSVLRYAKLLKLSSSGLIIAELGGAKKVAMTLGGVHDLMALQPNCEEGTLLTANDCANVLYAYDVMDVLRAVRVGQGDGGWSVGAYSVLPPYGWDKGCQVFSTLSP